MNNLRRLWLIALCLSGCASGVSGTWTGVMDSPNKVGVRFLLEEHEGRLAGRVFFEDPETRQLEPESLLTGTVSGGNATWTTETDVQVSGKFHGDSFAGTIMFPRYADEVGHSATLTLSR